MEAFQMTEEGADFCVKYGNFVAFPILVFNKGASLAELGMIDEAKKYLHQAITILEAMKKPKRVKIAIDWCKEHYDIEF